MLRAFLRRGFGWQAFLSSLCLCASVAVSAGCGYRVAGHSDTIPKSIHTIAVPTFKNETSRFKVEQALTSAVVRELLTRTRLHVQPTEDSSDAVLRGVVTAFYALPIVFDPQNGRATTMAINVRMRVSMIERKTGKVLYENPDYLYSDRYEISQVASGYFEESSAAMDRLSRTFAASLVSSLLEGF